jgi:hypothetical protein
MQSTGNIHSEGKPGLTLALSRRPRSASENPPRYPDDPVGDYETTDGGW